MILLQARVGGVRAQPGHINQMVAARACAQALLRGRAVQNMMAEGRERRSELISGEAVVAVWAGLSACRADGVPRADMVPRAHARVSAELREEATTREELAAEAGTNSATHS